MHVNSVILSTDAFVKIHSFNNVLIRGTITIQTPPRTQHGSVVIGRIQWQSHFSINNCFTEQEGAREVIVLLVVKTHDAWTLPEKVIVN